MANVKVSVLKNGPLKVDGPIELVQDGASLPVQGATVFLCRCGASGKKPFCDGAHARIGFKDEPSVTDV
ncbi:MAG TPA: CDGSH iron-sulfur domain-containing protein [Zoogloea sp.]|jgi:CDGSH-type Zn-finger protein|nr:CDGSH iron-sulfur domain-containing protein [Pseudomonadota bacterium]HRH71581.1 CDGSH iron-sulfur domain-containing protein [Zoogloea sp.]